METPKFEDRAIARIRNANRSLSDHRRKVHRLRRLFAGDVSALEDSRTTAGGARDPGSDLADDWGSGTEEFYDLLVTEFEEGRSNKLLVLIRTLLFQVAYAFPEIEFEDVDQSVASLNSAYCRVRLGPKPFGCDARHPMRLALLDSLIGGIGWSYVCMDNDRATIRHADALAVSWDLSARFPQDATWASTKVRKPFWYWKDHFGKDWGVYEKEFQDGSPDRPVELEYYYDVEKEGRFAVFAVEGEEPGLTILKDRTPCLFDVAGKDVPFLPFTPQYALSLPSVRIPVGLVETMLPHQVARWRTDRRMAEILDSASLRVIDETAISQEEYKKFLESDETGQALFARAPNAVQDLPPLGIDPTDMEYLKMNDAELVSQSGANPYATGDKVEGVSYAAEVNAIQSSASLMAGVLARDHAEFWIPTVRKFLALAARYDGSSPVSLTMDDTVLTFDAENPVGPYLRPNARIAIREDSMSYRSADQRRAEAMQRLQVAISVGQSFPGAVKKAFEDYLKASGVKNLDPWLESPQLGAGQVPVPPPIS